MYFLNIKLIFMGNNLRYGVLVVLLSAVFGFTNCKGTNDNKPSDTYRHTVDSTLIEGGETIKSLLTTKVNRIARVTGPTGAGENLPNPNQTLMNYNMATTDYGNMWDTGNGTVMSVFGDNFSDFDLNNWRSNAIALSSDRDLSDGIKYSGMLMEGNNIKEIIVSRQKTGQYSDASQYEETCIPTAGVSVDGNQYINYMSIHKWKTDGNDNWKVNYSEIVYSNDNGETWVRSGVKWGCNSNFAQVAYLKKDNKIYMYGTKSGRYGSVYLARVDEKSILDINAYDYWNGDSWVSDEAHAVAIANGTVSEMTVAYNSYYKRYIMMYLSVNQRSIVYRDASSPEGQWSGEKIIMEEDGNALYGPYIHPWFNNGKDLYFVISHAKPIWNVFLMHTQLIDDLLGFNILAEGGFEEFSDQPINYRTMWKVSNSTASPDAHSGQYSCKLSNETEGVWKDACVQTVVVKKNTNYVLTGWANVSVDSFMGAHFGIRKPDGSIDDINQKLVRNNWSKITKEFNTGNNTTVDVFFGAWGRDGLYVSIDDINLQLK